MVVLFKHLSIPAAFGTATLPASTDIQPARTFMYRLLAQEQNLNMIYSSSFFRTVASGPFSTPNHGIWMKVLILELPTLSIGQCSYSFIQCLVRAYRSHLVATLPINRLSFIKAKQIGIFIYSWFQSIDIKEGLKASHFDGPILGKRLQYWSALVNNPSVIQLWVSNPRELTFWWMH